MMLTIFHSMTLIVEIFVKFVSSPGFIRALGNSERIVKHIVFLFGQRATRIQLEWHLPFFTLPLFLTVAKKSKRHYQIIMFKIKVD